jgi:hypothetical protein
LLFRGVDYSQVSIYKVKDILIEVWLEL